MMTTKDTQCVHSGAMQRKFKTYQLFQFNIQCSFRPPGRIRVWMSGSCPTVMSHPVGQGRCLALRPCAVRHKIWVEKRSSFYPYLTPNGVGFYAKHLPGRSPTFMIAWDRMPPRALEPAWAFRTNCCGSPSVSNLRKICYRIQHKHWNHIKNEIQDLQANWFSRVKQGKFTRAGIYPGDINHPRHKWKKLT